eukprot:comp9287_c0_seq1/m.4394 comp9287_c0_seq1/g.4394  ORF comp9287_c0_seq1/g.4394 comp9287_c0_seq1/m.4394 type:complete len:144 (-) comp9287_c0_seq1:347-778(-)
MSYYTQVYAGGYGPRSGSSTSLFSSFFNDSNESVESPKPSYSYRRSPSVSSLDSMDSVENEPTLWETVTLPPAPKAGKTIEMVGLPHNCKSRAQRKTLSKQMSAPTPSCSQGKLVPSRSATIEGSLVFNGKQYHNSGNAFALY